MILTGGSVVLRDRIARADLRIEDGAIAEIIDRGPGGPEAPKFDMSRASADRPHGVAPRHDAAVGDCATCDILPGFVDLHTDNIERHLEPRPRLFWPPEQAIVAHDAEMAAAGVTTAFDAITLGGGFADEARQSFALRVVAMLDRARREPGLLRIDHRLHLRCELSEAGLPALLAQLGPIAPELVSLMNHTPGQRQWRDLEKFRVHYARRYGLSAADLTGLIAARERSGATIVPANRQDALALAVRTAARLASHDDTEAGDVDEAAAIGCCLSEFPTTAIAAAHAAVRGLSVVAGAPNLVSGGSHSGNVSAADLARDGHLHILSSDYRPSSLLPAMYLLRDRFGWSLPDAARTVSLTPALVMGLTDRGEIAPGRRADIIIATQIGRAHV